MASNQASSSNPFKKIQLTIIPPRQLDVNLSSDEDTTTTPSPITTSSSPSTPNSPSKTPSTKDTSSTFGTTSSSFESKPQPSSPSSNDIPSSQPSNTFLDTTTRILHFEKDRIWGDEVRRRGSFVYRPKNRQERRSGNKKAFQQISILKSLATWGKDDGITTLVKSILDGSALGSFGKGGVKVLSSSGKAPYYDDTIKALEAAFAVAVAEKIYAHESLTFSDTVACEIWDIKGLLDEANNNILGMEIIRDQSGNTLRVLQFRVYNGKSAQTLLERHFILSLEVSLSGDCDVEKNGKWSYTYEVGSQVYQGVCTRPDIASAAVGTLDGFDRGLQMDVYVFVDFDYDMGRSINVMAIKDAIWLKGLLRESGAELMLVASIVLLFLDKGNPSWPPSVFLGRLLPHARGLGFESLRGGFLSRWESVRFCPIDALIRG
ncbi:hypothetical protein Tco_0676624 [Tanacetum coccineum]